MISYLFWNTVMACLIVSNSRLWEHANLRQRFGTLVVWLAFQIVCLTSVLYVLDLADTWARGAI